MKRKDFLVLLLAVILVGLLMLISRHLPGRKLDISSQAKPAAASGPKDDESLSLTLWNAGDMLAQGENFLVVTQGKNMYAPVPLDQEGLLVLRQQDGKENTIALSADAFWMHAANCSNQDCVHQGRVTIDNRSQRVLQNMIICLPNEVILEFMTKAEAENYLGISH